MAWVSFKNILLFYNFIGAAESMAVAAGGIAKAVNDKKLDGQNGIWSKAA